MESDVSLLLEKIKNGNDDAFSELCEKYVSLIRSSADKYLRMLPEESEATVEDFKQEATLALYRAAKTFRLDQDKVTFGLYAKTCIRNALISLIRKLSRLPKISSEKSDRSEFSSVSEPLSGLISAENAGELLKKLSGVLSSYEYEVFVRYAEGKSPSHIAKDLGEEPKSVSNALFRARMKIKNLYEGT